MKYCRHCGKEVADEAVICLGCGCKTEYRPPIATPPTAAQPYAEAKDESTLAVCAFWCGIVSFFVGWLVLGITAIVLANMSKSETQGVMSTQAKIGLVCGIISTALSVLLFIILVSLLTL